MWTDERSVVPADAVSTGFVEARFEFVMLDGAAVILQRFGARGLPRRRRHGQVADFQELGRGEENHVDGIVVERIAEAALVDDERAHAGALGFDGAGEAGGAGADADDVVGFRHGMSLWPKWWGSSAEGAGTPKRPNFRTEKSS